MLQKIKQATITLVATMLLAFPVLAPVTVHAVTSDPLTNGLCNGLDNAQGGDADPNSENASCTTGDTETTGRINNIIHLVINLFSLIVGAVSIIMIIYGGFKYITSGGNDSSVSGAKNTIVYALIGLVIVALAQVIVRFVLAKATSV